MKVSRWNRSGVDKVHRRCNGRHMAKTKTKATAKKSRRSSVTFTPDDDRRLADILTIEQAKRPAVAMTTADILREAIYEAAKKRGVA